MLEAKAWSTLGPAREAWILKAQAPEALEMLRSPETIARD